MPQKRLHPGYHSADRHVSADKARRIRRVLLAALLAIALHSPTALCAGLNGLASKVTKTTELLRAPRRGASSLSRLPKGTVVVLTGERRTGYVEVEAEFDDETLTGWVLARTLDEKAAREIAEAVEEEQGNEELPDAEEKSEPEARVKKTETVDQGEPLKNEESLSQEEDSESLETTQEVEPRTPPKKKVKRLKVPTDEGILLKREESFFYGAQLVGGIALLEGFPQPDQGVAFTGQFFGGGGHIGFYLDREITLRFEATYYQSQGTSAAGEAMGIGFLDVLAGLDYLIKDFQISLAGSYAMAVSLGEFPISISLPSVSDLSTPVVHIGGGYRFPINDVLSIWGRLRYSFGLLRTFVGFQNIGVGVALEFRG